MFKKISIITAVMAFAVIAFPVSALAHVVVQPNQVGVAARQTFNVSVPNESETAEVVGVRLVIPEGLESARPNAKPGWTVNLKKEGIGEEAKVTEIIWTSAGGTVPVSLRDDFFFGAKAPAAEAELQWKAYETYSDGTIVAWDQAPKEGDEAVKPYSVTKVVNDLGKDTSATVVSTNNNDDAKDRANTALVLGGLGLLVALLSYARPKLAKK